MRGETVKVLLVEDDEDDYLLTRIIFQEIEGGAFDLRWASSFDAGLEAIDTFKPNVCLVDYLLGEHTGLELIRECRRRLCNIPMILLTGQDDRQVDLEATKAGAMDYLVKGQIGPQLLERSIRYAVERYRTVGKLQEFAEIVQSSDDAILGKTLEGTITSWNKSAERMYGYTAQEIIGKPIYTIVPHDRHAELSGILERLRKGERVERLETIRVRKDGVLVDVSVTISPIKDFGGRIIGASAIARDITERKRAGKAQEEMARQLEATAHAYQQVMDNSLDVICAIDEDGKFIRVSKACEKVWGYKPEELSGKRYIELVLPDDRLKTNQAAAEIMSGTAMRDFENRYIRKDGSEAHIMWSAVWSEEDKTMFCVARDVTEVKRSEEALRQIEEQLRQSQKMEAVGQLAGGVAHDFNNLLTAITGYTDLSMRKLREEDPIFHNLGEIRKAADRATSLTRQLLAFSRRQVLQPKVLDLNRIITDTEKMLARLIGEDIGLRTILDPALGSVRADPSQIEQVLMNLVINARDAMPEGGNLTVETQNVYLDADYAGRHIAVESGPYVLLAVSDTGLGMNNETKARIFEPFFTTKEHGKGTGLGLSTVYGIVKQSGGSIWVYSEPGEGTTFKIYLPRVDEVIPEYMRPGARSQSTHGSETILLAEDDELVRNLAREILEESGYTVLEAPNGGAALLLCEQHEGEIDLLLTDVVMPELSGRQLAERLEKIRPRIKVVYMSGYTADAVLRRGALEDEAKFIQKPFTPDALLHKVREALERHAGQEG
ncbi:MAG TPA: PAS domain S-box protein [Pyrinomonadaceae bacterium]|jgi:PAS domain S-box-containing protein